MSNTKEDKIKVLYIEDNLEFAELIQSQLAKQDFEVVIVASVTKFKTLFRKFRPDIVMVDLYLQNDMQGMEIIHYINTNFPFFPIIVYSAHSDSSTIIGTMQCGVMHHVSKDRSITELVVILKNAIRQAYRYGENFQPEYQLSETITYNIKSCILSINDKDTLLKRTESRMLRQLCLRINEFVSPVELSKATWGIEKTAAQLYRSISGLRKIIEPYDPSIKIINKRGSHYQLECQKWK